MLEGLEISEIKLSDIMSDNKSLRIDSTYFIKNSVLMDKKLKNLSHFFLKNKEIVSGPFGSTLKSHSYLTKGVPFVRIQNIKGGFEIQCTDIIYISETDNQLLKNSQLIIDDLVLSKVGNTIGYYARVDEELRRCNISENNIGIKLSSYSVARRHYILTFLNSLYGKTLTLRKTSGNAQPKLNVSDISEIPIPQKNEEFENKISYLIVLSRNLKHESIFTYKRAELMLLDILALADFSPSEEQVNIKSFKDSFATTGRLDAEYYQKKYDDIESHIKHHNRCDFLANLIIHIDTGEYSPEYFSKNEIEGLTFYIRSTNIKCGQIEFDDNYYVKKKNFVRIAKKGGIVTARVGSLGIFGEVRDELNGAIYSDNVLCFYLPDCYIPSVYTLLFNSKFFFEMIDRLARGSVQQRLNQETLKDLIIPLIDYDKQRQIAVLIEESFALKVKSKRLLNVAKRAVEIAIEQDEETATKWIQEQLNTNE